MVPELGTDMGICQDVVSLLLACAENYLKGGQYGEHFGFAHQGHEEHCVGPGRAAQSDSQSLTEVGEQLSLNLWLRLGYLLSLPS